MYRNNIVFEFIMTPDLYHLVTVVSYHFTSLTMNVVLGSRDNYL